MQEQIKQIMADILDLDPNSIDGSTTKDNTASWDSLNHINLVLVLEQEFAVAFVPSEMESMISFENIVRLLEKKRQE